jgi:hypothetical protein
VLTGPFSPLFGPFFRVKRAGPARLGPLRAGLGQKIKPAGSVGPARFLAGLHRARAGQLVWPSLTKGEVADSARETGYDHRGCQPEQFHVHDYQKNREPNTNNEGSDHGQT